MKKVLLAALLILALSLSLVACGGKTADTPATPDAPATPDTPAVTDAPLDPDSVGGKLAALGFNELDLLVGSQDYIEIDENNDFTLYSTQSFEEVARALYAACQKAADDGKVLDYWSEEPIDFTYAGEEDMDFAYYRNGQFEDVMINLIWVDEETGYTEYLLQWD